MPKIKSHRKHQQAIASDRKIFPILNLPQEIIFRIFEYFSSEELFNLCVLCSHMKTKVIAYDEIWQRKIRKEFSHVEPTWYGFYNELSKQAQVKKRAEEERTRRMKRDPIGTILDDPNFGKRFSEIIRKDRGLPPLDDPHPPLAKKPRNSP